MWSSMLPQKRPAWVGGVHPGAPPHLAWSRGPAAGGACAVWVTSPLWSQAPHPGEEKFSQGDEVRGLEAQARCPTCCCPGPHLSLRARAFPTVPCTAELTRAVGALTRHRGAQVGGSLSPALGCQGSKTTGGTEPASGTPEAWARARSAGNFHWRVNSSRKFRVPKTDNQPPTCTGTCL